MRADLDTHELHLQRNSLCLFSTLWFMELQTVFYCTKYIIEFYRLLAYTVLPYKGAGLLNVVVERPRVSKIS